MKDAPMNKTSEQPVVTEGVEAHTPEALEQARRIIALAEDAEAGEVSIVGGRRCAISSSEWLSGWFVGYSPRNGENASVEGPWEDWVTLARSILEIEAARSALSKATAQPKDGV